MPSLAVLSPINESEELSPYRSRFPYVRYPGQRSPIGTKGSFQDARDALASPSTPNVEVTMDDLWIYDCYASEDATSPGGSYYPYSPLTPSTPSHNRTMSLPVSTSNFVPPNNAPLIKEPAPHRPPMLDVPYYDAYQVVDLTDDPGVSEHSPGSGLPVINTAVYSPAEFLEYSPLEQEAFSTGEVIDQLAAVVDLFADVESVLEYASIASPPPDVDEDTVFWFIEALNIFASDCSEVASELLKFSEYVDALITDERHRAFPPIRVLPRASFSERDMQEVLADAAEIPKSEVEEALAELEATVPPSPQGKRMSRDRPPSLRLSTNDAVLLQASLQPRSRMQSVGAVGRFSEHETSRTTAKKHRAYVVYGEDTPIEDNWSAKSIVDYGNERSPLGDGAEPEQPQSASRTRPTSGQTTVQRPLSSPVSIMFDGPKIFAARARPPSLSLDSPRSPRSNRSTSSSVSSLFSSLPRSSFTSTSSPRSSPRQSMFDKADKARFPASSVKFKKMFTNIFKNKDGTLRTSNLASNITSNMTVRPFARRTAGSGSIDATLTALGLSTPSSLPRDPDPFAASPPPSATLQPQPNPSRASDQSALDGYSNMFNSLKAASRYPNQPLFQGIHEDFQ